MKTLLEKTSLNYLVRSFLFQDQMNKVNLKPGCMKKEQQMGYMSHILSLRTTSLHVFFL